MYTVMDSTERRPATPSICQGRQEEISNHVSGTYSCTSPLKPAIYHFRGH